MRYSRTIELGMQSDSLGDWVRFEDYAELEAKLAAAEADAGRWRLIREHIAPAYLERNGFPRLGDIPESECIAERIDRIVDAAIDTARGVE